MNKLTFLNRLYDSSIKLLIKDQNLVKKGESIFIMLSSLFLITFIYPFMIISPEWGMFLISFIFTFVFSYYFGVLIGNQFYTIVFIPIIIFQAFTIFYADSIRNSSNKKIEITGRVILVQNSFKYVHFYLDKYKNDDITFKSYSYDVMESFKKNILKNNEEVSENVGKKVKIVVSKSQLNWLQNGYASNFRNSSYPLELEIGSFQIIE